MKAIFLDIDGVLNNTLAPGVMHWNSTLPHCVENINKIVDSTGAKIFVISSWVDDVFFDGNNLKLEQFLSNRGLKEGSIVGFRRKGISKEEGIFELVTSNIEIDSFIILDDNPEIVKNDFLKSRHIITQSLVGLSEEDVVKSIELLINDKL